MDGTHKIWLTTFFSLSAEGFVRFVAQNQQKSVTKKTCLKKNALGMCAGLLMDRKLCNNWFYCIVAVFLAHKIRGSLRAHSITLCTGMTYWFLSIDLSLWNNLNTPAVTFQSILYTFCHDNLQSKCIYSEFLHGSFHFLLKAIRYEINLYIVTVIEFNYPQVF